MITSNTKYTTKNVFELIEEVAKASKKADKLKLLKTMNEEHALKDILKGTYDDRIKWLIPKGSAPYTPASEESAPSNLRKRYKEFAYFAMGGPGTKMPAVKREKMFLSLIESIHPNDAKLVVDMINKKNIKGITKKLVQEAFPGMVK